MGIREREGLEQRKHRDDGTSWTPTESRIRDKLMKQFCKLESSTNSSLYDSSPLWCDACHNHMKVQGTNLCRRCTEDHVVPVPEESR